MQLTHYIQEEQNIEANKVANRLGGNDWQANQNTQNTDKSCFNQKPKPHNNIRKKQGVIKHDML